MVGKEYSKEDVETLLLNGAYYMIYGASILMYRMEGMDATNKKLFYKKRERLESAARLIEGAAKTLVDGGAMTKKARELLVKVGNILDKANDSTHVAARMLQAAVAELELFDDDFGNMSAANVHEAHKDANELSAVMLLYMYDTYINASFYADTIRFLEGLSEKPIDYNVKKEIDYFIKKSN